eukprot:CAMPEP_0197565358 /NCGR_PEP_ID=MMETSP1320-20131121/32015_1 /TAXON_ID=91990 /ORGANISM="Bolidomonas sp., Strain RCC2347" /LENGTH=156 /DNA_ID=CAMNT_0043127343 /DNA_START=139 /DNA_END=609 /DNA_ORIENTATION=+
MTPLRPTVTSTLRSTTVPPSALWEVYEKFSWETFDKSVKTVAPATSTSAKLQIGAPINISTVSPSFSGKTNILACFKDQKGAGQFTFALPLNPMCTVTRTYDIDVCAQTGATSVTHGVRYDGALKFLYEGGLTEEALQDSVEKLLEEAKAATPTLP